MMAARESCHISDLVRDNCINNFSLKSLHLSPYRFSSCYDDKRWIMRNPWNPILILMVTLSKNDIANATIRGYPLKWTLKHDNEMSSNTSNFWLIQMGEIRKGQHTPALVELSKSCLSIICLIWT